MKTAQDSYTITIKQIVRFQERMHLEKFQVDKILNGRPSAIIHLDRADIAEYHENRHYNVIKSRHGYSAIQKLLLKNVRYIRVNCYQYHKLLNSILFYFYSCPYDKQTSNQAFHS